jgi:hypothetical protein
MSRGCKATSIGSDESDSSYMFTAQRYTFSVHENVYTKVKSCMSTRTSTRTIMRLQENYPLSTARSFHFNSFDILIITKVLS